MCERTDGKLGRAGNEANWQRITAMIGSSRLQWWVGWNTWAEAGVWWSMKRRMTWEPDNEIWNKQNQRSPHCIVQDTVVKYKTTYALSIVYFFRLSPCMNKTHAFPHGKLGRVCTVHGTRLHITLSLLWHSVASRQYFSLLSALQLDDNMWMKQLNVFQNNCNLGVIFLTSVPEA